MAKKMKVWDQRMLILLSHRLEIGETHKDFCKAIGIEASNLSLIKKSGRSFTVEQIHAACRRYNVNPSWIMGFSTEMKIKAGKSPLMQLKEAIKAVEAQLLK